MNSRKMSQIDSIFYVIFIFISKYAVNHSLQIYVYVSTVLIFLDMYCMLLSIEVDLFRLGMEQDHLKTIVNDILDMDSNNKWEVTTNRFIR